VLIVISGLRAISMHLKVTAARHAVTFSNHGVRRATIRKRDLEPTTALIIIIQEFQNDLVGLTNFVNQYKAPVGYLDEVEFVD
jgi:hypothetical protein